MYGKGGGKDQMYKGGGDMYKGGGDMYKGGPPPPMHGGPGGPPPPMHGGPPGAPMGEPPTAMNPNASDFEKENDFVNFFRYIQGHHSCTHSSMIGPSDHRIPKSGKFDVTKQDCLEKLYAAIGFFYRKQQPLVLCEIATSRFRFFEDVDLLVPESLKDDLPRLQEAWIGHLLRHRAAVLAAIWRSDDALGTKPREGPATVHVFSSSGWASQKNQPKISLHFVWPELIVTPKEAKGIRSATIEFLRESCSQELQDLLSMSFSSPNFDSDMSPWEEIFDKAATEGTSLRLVFCDKGAKADREMNTAAKLEGRPKVPIATYKVPLVVGDPVACTPEPVCFSNQKEDIQWLFDATIRLDMANPPEISNVWLSASQTKGMGGIQKPSIPHVPTPMPRKEDAHDQYVNIRQALMGMWVDSNSNWLQVKDYPAESQMDKSLMMVCQVSDGQQCAELQISPDVYSFPVNVYFSAPGGKKYTMHYQPGTDKYGTWFAEDGGDNWMWRRPAVSDKQWPAWADQILIEVAGHADPNDSSMGLGVIVCAISNNPVRGENFWEGHMSFNTRDFGDVTGAHAVNVPMATVAAVAFGMRAVLDLRSQITGPKIEGIIISSDHTVVDAAMEGQNNQPYLEPLIQLLTSYKNDILSDEVDFPNVREIKSSKIAASANKAGKIAKEARANALDEETVGTTVGDVELFDAVLASYERAPASNRPIQEGAY